MRNWSYVRHCEWRSGYTPDVLTAPTGWRQQPSCPLPCQPRLGLELSVFSRMAPRRVPTGAGAVAQGRTTVFQRRSRRPKCYRELPFKTLPETSSEVAGNLIYGYRLNLSTRCRAAERKVLSAHGVIHQPASFSSGPSRQRSYRLPDAPGSTRKPKAAAWRNGKKNGPTRCPAELMSGHPSQPGGERRSPRKPENRRVTTIVQRTSIGVERTT